MLNSNAPEDPDTVANGFLSHTDALRYRASKSSFTKAEKNGIVLRLVKPGTRVLDVGCGTGDSLKMLRDHNRCEVVGIEPNSVRATQAKNDEISIHHIAIEDAEPESLGLFNYVLLLDVLEHLRNPHETLINVARFLVPGGSVIVSVPNVAHWSVRINLLFGQFDYTESEIMDATHLRWFTKKSSLELIKSTGYQLCSYNVSAGTWLSLYKTSIPWRWIPNPMRDKTIRAFRKLMPSLFGAQHIICATYLPNE